MIPIGARNIRVEEVAAANNFLALQNNRGEYYLNGHWFIQWSGDYKIAGTTVHYEREGNMESVTAQGPLKEPLHVMVRQTLRILHWFEEQINKSVLRVTVWLQKVHQVTPNSDPESRFVHMFFKIMIYSFSCILFSKKYSEFMSAITSFFTLL